MLPPVDELKTTLEQQLPGATLTVDSGALRIAPQDLPAVCLHLKTSDRFQLDYLANLTAVDFPPDPTSGAGRIELVYHLYSMAQKHGPLTLKVTLPRNEARAASVTPIWRGAEYQEREVYDLFGVTFEGHPDLRRILLWDGFGGHPMRKDYAPEDQNVLEERSRA